MPDSPVRLSDLPVTLVTGYLGSGKTTFINQCLLNSGGIRYAVLVNDFGQLNIDAKLISAKTDRTISLVNGCVCCSLADDLDGALEQVQEFAQELDWVLFEASGVADPERIRSRIAARPGYELKEFVILIDVSRILTLANDKFVGGHIRRQLQLAFNPNNQLAIHGNIATRIRYSKVDLLEASALKDTQDWLLGFVSDRDNDSEDRAHTIEDQSQLPRFYTRTIETAQPLTREKLESWLKNIDPEISRIKGLVYLVENPDRPWLLQWVEGNWSVERFESLPGAAKTQLILISTSPINIASLVP